jgi:hypothetical protein
VDPEALLELLADQTAATPTSLTAEVLQSEPEELTKRIFIAPGFAGGYLLSHGSCHWRKGFEFCLHY